MYKKIKNYKTPAEEITLKIAIQKSGRLYDGSMQLMKECGIELSNGNNHLRIVSGNYPVEIFFSVMMIYRNMYRMLLLTLVLWVRMW